MKKLSKALSIALVAATMTAGLTTTAQACSRVFMNDQEGYLVSGRNLDFFGPVDPSLMITPKGIDRVGGDDPKAAKWTSQYGSVVVYAGGVFPMDGMNEKGLAGHTLYYSNGSQAQADNLDKPVLESRAWLSYILDNYATVEEAIEGIKNVRLVAAKVEIDYATDTKHIAIEDTTGDSAIIEIDNGQVNIYHDSEYRVMTNPPSYADQLANLAKYRDAARTDIPTRLDADQRFVRAAYDLHNLPTPDNKYQAQGFVKSVLNNVAYPIGIPTGPDEQHVIDDYAKYSKKPQENKGIGTYWTTISDLLNGEFYFKSVYAPTSVHVIFDEINFDKGQPVLEVKDLNNYAVHGLEGNILSAAKPVK